MVELQPLGATCNLTCRYCYQGPLRQIEGVRQSYDLAAMQAAIEREGVSFNLSGGEGLLLPERDLEELWSWGFKRFGEDSLQTNGALLRESHIAMFKQYGVGVGVSVDGPGEMNDLRWAGSIENTRAATARTARAIEMLCANGIIPGLIVTLHRLNAEADKLPIMNEWFRSLERLGVKSVRLHVLECEDAGIRQRYALSAAEYAQAFLNFVELESTLEHLRFDVFEDIRSLLAGKEAGVTCIWRGCDPYFSRPFRVVDGQANGSNCCRTHKEGIRFMRGDCPSAERYLALYYTDQQCGGCGGCRFFLMCKGQCPGTAIDGDWRNRSEYCDVWRGLFEFFEQKAVAVGATPLSRNPTRERLEEKMVDAWMSGLNPNLEDLLAELTPAPPPPELPVS